MYGMTTLTPSINLSVEGFGFLLVFCWCSGCLVGLCEGDPFPLQGIQV